VGVGRKIHKHNITLSSKQNRTKKKKVRKNFQLERHLWMWAEEQTKH
jgi:hypothetical protein